MTQTKYTYLWHGFACNRNQRRDPEWRACVWGACSMCVCSTPPTSISVATTRAHPSITADTFTSGLVAVAIRAVRELAWISAGLCTARTESNCVDAACHCDWAVSFVKFTVTLTRCAPCVPHTYRTQGVTLLHYAITIMLTIIMV